MSPSTLADFFESLGTQLEAYLAKTVREHIAAAREDAEAFLAMTQADLKRWVAALVQGQLSADEFTSLVRGQAALCKLEALEQAGLAKIRLDQIRNGILDLVLDAAFKVTV